MGEEGIALINSIEDVEAMIIIRTDENMSKSVESFGWGKFESDVL